MALNDDLKDNNNLIREQNELLKQRMGIGEETLDDARDFANVISDQTKQIQFQVSEKRQLRSISSQIVKISQESFNITEKELISSKGLISITKNRKSLEQSLLGLGSLKNKINVENKELQSEINSNIDAQISTTQSLIKELGRVEEMSAKVGKNFGVKSFGALSDITKSIPGLRKFSEPFKEAEEATRKTSLANLKANEIKSLGNKISQKDIKRLGLEGKLISKNGKMLSGSAAFSKAQSLGLIKTNSTLMAGTKALGPALKKALGPLGLILEFLSAITEADKQIVGLQKSMALSTGEAIAFKGELSEVAALTFDNNITATKLLKTFTDLNKQFGFITNFSSDTLVTMTKLTSKVKLSSEAAGSLAAASSLSGKSFESNYKDVLGTSYELQRQEGVQFNLRDILEQTGKVTGTVRANLGANPANIAKAVTQAKLFGATLEQVSSAGKTLLDFESSITSELEAELLLGRDINLEKARLAALNGDQVTLAKELRKEAGDYAEFTNMNVLQQEALAKSLGMQSDALADILFQQDVQGKNAKELRALGKDDLADRLEKQTMGEKFNDTMAKLKDMLVDVFTAVSPILNIFTSILSVVGFILSPISALIGAANKLGDVIGGVVGLLTAAAIAAITLGSGLTLGLGVAAIVAGTIAGIAILNSNQEKAKQVGDINSPAYGKTQISTKEGGLFELSKNDDIVAFPGASRAMAQAGQSQPQVAIQNDNTESKKTNQLLERILSKQGTVNLDSTAMGTAMSVNRYAIQ